MKIPDDERISGLHPHVDRVSRARGEAPEAGRRRPDPARGDEVSLSSRAQEYSRARELLDEVPEVREARVQALKAAIEQGRDTVGGEEIAEAMLRDGVLRDLIDDGEG